MRRVPPSADPRSRVSSRPRASPEQAAPAHDTTIGPYVSCSCRPRCERIFRARAARTWDFSVCISTSARGEQILECMKRALLLLLATSLYACSAADGGIAGDPAESDSGFDPSGDDGAVTEDGGTEDGGTEDGSTTEDGTAKDTGT